MSQDEKNTMTIEMIPMLETLPDCSDRGCELDASVYITTNGSERKAWCTGHAHCEIAVWMVGPVNWRDSMAYEGRYASFRELPWLHMMEHPPIMPYKVHEIVPVGYVVFISAGGTYFKMLNNPVLVEGDVIE